MDISDKIRIIEDFPKKGISFKDITTLIRDGEAFKYVINTMADNLKDKNIKYIAAPEARGFILGSAVAYAMGVGFIPIRKPGKLPGETISYEYDLEYGKDELVMHTDAIDIGERVAIVDDLLATGGTVNALAKIVEKAGGIVAAMEFLIELEELNGRELNSEYEINSLVKYNV
ncbi:adenine phosphoribosyltransferase [Miniphocaeibacter halophilus]|uniref:Adenine phosphoribosyltransferase n=1 Tax=Miniphocaeibacter halophilus TaxID=2931922 RepID=A0AC61MPM6_9FIRM|nr:adenine phosphoribosyltransferase [Miniphocaeibacter halophilus]QQK07382.1 adenine phosphoribosyltransferase [Miniphocaeibacter halophilus]